MAPEAGHVALVVWMVRDDRDHVRVELASAAPPQKVEQAVVVARHEHRDPLRNARVCEPPLHVEAGRRLSHRLLELGAPVAEALQMELGAEEERATLGVSRVLVSLDDVGAEFEKECGDGGDNPVAIRARDEEAGGVGGGHARQR
jgi:hypothetical protein